MKYGLLLLTLVSSLANADVILYGQIRNGFGMINKKNSQSQEHGDNLILSNDATCKLVYKKINSDAELWLYGLSGKLIVRNNVYTANQTEPWTKWTTKATNKKVRAINKSTSDCYELYDWASDKFVRGRNNHITELKKN